MIRVTVWNEAVHERENPAIRAIYPEGIHGCIAACLKANATIDVRTATLDEPECGLPEAVLDETDVLIWWGHHHHDAIPAPLVETIKTRVLQGMGLIALHSAHHSRIMKALLGTSLNLRWRHGDRERLWCVLPSHPIAEGIPASIEIEQEEMYGEFFDIPTPDEVVFLGWFAGGEVFRSGCTFTRGRGKIFYFQPGHEEYPIYHQKEIQDILVNAVRWARPVNRDGEPLSCIGTPPSPESLRSGA